MKINNMISLLALSGIIISSTYVKAEDNPEALVKIVAEVSQIKPESKKSPDQRWQNFLASKGWDTELSAGGVIFIEDRELIISSASEFTKVRLGQPGWVESRVVAFEKAEMEAKTKIIRYLAESVETRRSLGLLEHAMWNDGEVDKIKDLNEVAETLKRIGNKTMALTESGLDQALQKLDPDYDPAKYQGKSVNELQLIAEDLFKRQITSTSMGTLIGVTQLYSTEEKLSENEYQVLVGVIWSPRLNRLAMSLFNQEYNIPAVKPGKTLTAQIPADELTLLSALGTRIVIDENGQYAIMSYGQAQPRRSSPARQEAVLHQAKQIAANRARSHLVNFIQEGMTLRETEISQELSRDFSDMTFGTETVRDYQKSIKSKKIKVKLSGLRVLKEWSFKHPVTGQQVAGTVMAWSPASANLSKRAAEVMSAPAKAKKKADAAAKGATQSDTAELESMKLDTSAY